MKTLTKIFNFLYTWLFEDREVMDWVVIIFGFLCGFFILKDIEFALCVTGTETINWNSSFADVPVAVGWYSLIVAFDLLILRCRAHFVFIRYCIWPLLKKLLVKILGSKRYDVIKGRLLKLQEDESNKRGV